MGSGRLCEQPEASVAVSSEEDYDTYLHALGEALKETSSLLHAYAPKPVPLRGGRSDSRACKKQNETRRYGGEKIKRACSRRMTTVLNTHTINHLKGDCV